MDDEARGKRKDGKNPAQSQRLLGVYAPTISQGKSYECACEVFAYEYRAACDAGIAVGVTPHIGNI